jgi:DNA modification methylase
MIKLINDDCKNVLSKLKDNSINLVLTDPPYNIARKTNFHTMKGHRGTSMDFGDWDYDADILTYIEELPRILKKGGNVVIFNDWKNISDISKKMVEVGIEPKRCLVLSKSNPAPFNRDRLFVNDVEFAVWGVYDKGWVFNREDNLQKCIFNTKVQSKEFHPTMKDLEVISKMIRILSNENDIVLDPFMGSGTTGMGCKKLNRHFIGIEINKEYFEITKTRLGV